MSLKMTEKEEEIASSFPLPNPPLHLWRPRLAFPAPPPGSLWLVSASAAANIGDSGAWAHARVHALQTRALPLPTDDWETALTEATGLLVAALCCEVLCTPLHAGALTRALLMACCLVFPGASSGVHPLEGGRASNGAGQAELPSEWGGDAGEEMGDPLTTLCLRFLTGNGLLGNLWAWRRDGSQLSLAAISHLATGRCTWHNPEGTACCHLSHPACCRKCCCELPD